MLEAPIDLLDPASRSDLHVDMLEALVAGEGLAAVAAIATSMAGASVEILIPRSGSDGTVGSDAERHVADLVAGREVTRPAEVRDLVLIVCRDQMEGAVVLLGDGLPQAHDVMETAGLVAMTGVALLNARADASEDSAGALIRELLAGAWIPPGEVVRRARVHGCDLSGRFIAVALEPLEVDSGRVVAAVGSERPDALVGRGLDRVHVLLPGSPDDFRELGIGLASIAAHASSSSYRTAKDAAIALREADLLLTMARDAGLRDTDRKAWSTIRFLFRYVVSAPGELGQFIEEAVGPALRYDEDPDAELERTFLAFRDANWNLSRAAQLTFAHRQTVRNRLDRLAELTGLDPDDSYDRDLLTLAFLANTVATHYGEGRPNLA
jgi:hypothetical protein